MKKESTITTASLLKLATYASVSTATLLIIVKFIAWFMTDSLSVLASLVDSFMDVAASLINLLAVRYSLKSADEDHTFGHGKAEYLAGLGQASFICGSAIFLFMHAAERLTHPAQLTALGAGVAVMLFAIVATLILLSIQRYVIGKTNSTAIRADSLHYLTDLLTNISTIGALFLASHGWPHADPLFAIAIGIFILYTAVKIGYEAVQMLMDRQLPQEIRQALCDIALANKKVLGVHDLRTRQSGQISVIQLHLEFDDTIPLVEAHAAAKQVEKEILAQFPGSDITIHQDPISQKRGSLQDEACPPKSVL